MLISLSRGRTYIDRSFSFILSVWVWVGTAPILIGHLPCSVWVGVAPISISHLPITFHVSFWVSGPHLYRSVIILSIWVWVGTASISIGYFHSSCPFESESGPHLYRSIIFLSLFVSGPHLYRSVIFCVAPISIGHPLVSLCSVWVGTAPISTGHHLVSMSLRFGVRTHIDRPYSYQLMFSLS